MKSIFSVIGLVVAWGVYKYTPNVFPAVTGITGLSAALIVIAGLLTAVWALDLARLSVFEKLDELTSDQKEVAIKKSQKIRGQIVFSMFTNTLLLVAVIIAVNLLGVSDLKNQMSSWIGYMICSALGYWVAGFVESWYCWIAIDQSRLSLAAAQSANKQRIKYLEGLRADEAKAPFNRKDPHLKGYTEDYKPC